MGRQPDLSAPLPQEYTALFKEIEERLLRLIMQDPGRYSFVPPIPMFTHESDLLGKPRIKGLKVYSPSEKEDSTLAAFSTVRCIAGNPFFPPSLTNMHPVAQIDLYTLLVGSAVRIQCNHELADYTILIEPNNVIRIFNNASLPFCSLRMNFVATPAALLVNTIGQKGLLVLSPSFAHLTPGILERGHRITMPYFAACEHTTDFLKHREDWGYSAYNEELPFINMELD